MSPNESSIIAPAEQGNSCLSEAYSDDQFHLPLHVQPQSMNGSDVDSECTNPRLQHLLDRYFQSDDETDFDADEESEPRFITSGSTQKASRKNPRRRRKAKGFMTQSQPYSSMLLEEMSKIPSSPNRGNPKEIDSSKTQFHTPTLKSKVIDLKDPTINKKSQGINNINSLRTITQRYNAWDSSPSTVADEDEQSKSISFDMYFNPIGEDDHSINVRKHLFADEGVADSHNENVFNISHGCDKDFELNDDSDLELTQRSRQIQYDLRLQEMTELALEAERAAEAGEEKFVGNATRFELGLGLDVDGKDSAALTPRSRGIHRRSWPTEDFDFNRPEHNAMTPLRGHGHLNIHNRLTIERPSTEIKKPKAIIHGSRQVSAPSKLQSKKTGISTIPSILTSGTFLSVAPVNDAKEKIPVLALRHIEEVIPSFKEMHPFLKANLLRCGVKYAKGNLKTVNSSLPNATQPGSIAPNASFMKRVPSFQIIMQSMSGLSGTGKSSKAHTSDDEISYAGKEEVDSDLSLGPDHMALDCVSFVSCGDLNDDIIATPEKKKIECEIDEEIISTLDFYTSTLATELHDPMQPKRSISPLPKAPYSIDSDDSIKIAPQRASALPRSRWTTFWNNISPAKRSLSISSPMRLPLNRNSWSLAGNNGVVKPRIDNKNHSSGSDQEDMRRETYLYLNRALGKEKSAPASWEIPKNRDSNRIFLSSQPFSRGVRNTQCPSWIDSNVQSYDISEQIQGRSVVMDTSEITYGDEKNVLGTDQKTVCSNHNSKGSFRTYTTSQMSCDESQSSLYSKFSDASLPSCMASTKCNMTTPNFLTIRPNEAAFLTGASSILANTRADLNSNVNESDTLPYKPPLHPDVGIKHCSNFLINSNCRESSFMKVENQILPTIEASISCQELSEASSGLSTASEEHNEIAFCNETSVKIGDIVERTCETTYVRTSLPLLPEAKTIDSRKLSDAMPCNPNPPQSTATSAVDSNNGNFPHSDSFGKVENYILPTIEALISGPDFCEATPALGTTSEDNHLSAAVDGPPIAEPVNKVIKEVAINPMQLWGEGGTLLSPNDIPGANPAVVLKIESQLKSNEQASLDVLDDTSTFSDGDENNRSTMSFIDLIEKVPSVINRFRPFKASKQQDSDYQDDVTFVDNYFFTGVEPNEANRRTKTEQKPRNKYLFGGGACLDLNCVSVMESALTYLSADSPRDRSNHVVQRNYLSENYKYGRLDNTARKKRVNFGGRLFKSPNLMNSKRSLVDEQIGQSFETKGADVIV